MTLSDIVKDIEHLSSYPPNLFSPSFSKCTFQKLPVYFILPALMSMSLRHTMPHSTPDTFFFGSKFNLPVNSLFLSMNIFFSAVNFLFIVSIF